MFRKLWPKITPEEKKDLAAGPAAVELDRKSILAIVSGAFQLSAHVLAGHGDTLTGQMVARLSAFEDSTLENILQRGRDPPQFDARGRLSACLDQRRVAQDRKSVV